MAEKGLGAVGSLAPITLQHPKPRQRSFDEAKTLHARMPCASQHRPFTPGQDACPSREHPTAVPVGLTPYMKITPQRPAGLEGPWTLSSPNHLISQIKTRAQKGQVTCLRSQSSQLEELGLDPKAV